MVSPPRSSPSLLLLLFLLLTGHALAQAQTVPAGCGGLVEAEVVALDQPFSWNRYGALQPQGMIYALKRDVVNSADADGLPSPGEVQVLAAGQVSLRRDKRPRPLVLRVNAGQCLRIHFTNLLNSTREHEQQPATRHASVHVIGMQLLSISDDGSFVGTNPNSTVAPGGSLTYTLLAEREGTFLMHSMGAIVGGEGDGGSISAGLFGAVNVEPASSEWYRSQVTKADLALAMASSPDQHPRIDYNALYPAGHRYAGLPILKMLQNGRVVHSDLTALITGPGAGDFTSHFGTTKIYPDRQKPFRELTIIFHDEIGAVQAFKEFEGRVLEFTLHSVRDAFAINYGTGGIGAEVLANRFGVGPGWDCAECKYEEFFLTSWVVGDPAMVVDKPANHPCDQTGLTGCTPTPGPKATKAFYPDDPSNVYHSYLNDHVKFRNLHAGTDDHHIFHLHAHQWLHSPRNDRSSYLDSQSIGQGASFTYEIAYGGGGNRNKTVGDAIFHCHFYPHFAQGMWGLWRVHDVLETGTQMDADGRPSAGARALPDNEINRGTPIPAVVPVPTIAMAPLPGPVSLNASGQIALPNPVTVNPGYPFFIPGKAGRRPPHPPLDTIFDGGLPRHLVESGTATSVQNRLDFHKRIDTLMPRWLAETGEPVEVVAMSFHNKPAGYTTPLPKAGAGTGIYRVNRGGGVRGAPYADPCIDDQGNPVTRMRYYKAADIQIDAIFNKSGWHFPQQRMIVLQDDVVPTLLGTRTPEPLFIRARSGECVEYWLTNLTPSEYQLDDFQVRTPTDILGQHIHLVKFDVTASDGAANGYNYEDGSFAGEEVQERLCAIRRRTPVLCGESTNPGVACNFNVVSPQCPVPKLHPIFQDLGKNADCDHDPDWWGAQTTVQRWWADPIPIQGSTQTRTLRTVFTHDHFGPSTHQQAGLYAGLIVEPDGTDWFHNEAGYQLSVDNGPGWNQDGGPTSWQAVIEGTRVEDNFREFALQVQDFTLAYRPGGPVCPDPVNGFADFARAVNPPGRKLVGPPVLYENPANCPTNDGSLGPPRPCPEAVSADDPGMTSFNYRNEPLALRISTPADVQTSGRAGDLSFAYMTRRDRARPEFNVFPFAPYLPGVPYGPLTNGLRRGDPFTPLLRAYEGDRVIVRTFGGAHEEEHNFTIHAMKWLFEPEWSNSGWRNSQQYGISEWFDFVIPRMPSLKRGEFADFLYKPTAASEWQWNGAWGLVRLYRGPRGNSSHSLTASLEAATSPTPGGTVGTTTAPAPIDAEQTEDAADAVQPGDLDVQDDESLLVLRDQNPDAEAPEGAGVFAEVPLEEAQADRVVLSRNPAAEAVPAGSAGTTTGAFEVSAEATGSGNIRIPCPAGATVRTVEVTAVAAFEALLNDPLASLVYNSRSTTVTTHTDPDEPVEPATRSGPLHDPTAILFVHDTDLTWVGGRPRLSLSVRREPLILRANQGECIKVKLRNALPGSYADQPGWNAMPMIIEGFNANDVRPSKHVSLHPQLVYYDVRQGDGSNAGLNPKVYHRQTVAPGERKTFYWYAGEATVNGGQLTFTSIEFGATGLSSADPIKHTNKGAVGALLIEPQGSSWTLDTMPEAVPFQTFRPSRTTRASATVTTGTSSFKEFVLIVQNDVNLRYEDGDPVESLDVNEDPTESAQKAVNYKTEPVWFRTGKAPDTPMEDRGDFASYHQVLSNAWIGNLDPETPVFQATRNRATRIRLINPGGHTQAHAFDLHGHLWEELPYINNSRNLGTNASSEWQGTRGGHGPTNHHEAILKNGAGGKSAPVGDYLYREYAGWLLDDGIWGILRVAQ